MKSDKELMEAKLKDIDIDIKWCENRLRTLQMEKLALLDLKVKGSINDK